MLTTKAKNASNLFWGLVTALNVIGTLSVMWLASAHGNPSNQAQTSKYDGDCTGQETVGRCADKYHIAPAVPIEQTAQEESGK